MSWLLALLYVVSGVALGVGAFFLGIVRVFESPDLRRQWFRVQAKHYPDDFEAALQHHHVLHPQRDTLPDAIQFATCKHCTLPWPTLEDGSLIDHPRFDERLARATCPGSFTYDFLETK